VNAEFNWWLLIVGLVVGAGLVWFVVIDSRRRDEEIDALERPREALWLSAALADEGWDVSPQVAERMLLLHRAYLEAPPPDPDIVPDVDRDVDPDPAAGGGSEGRATGVDDGVAPAGPQRSPAMTGSASSDEPPTSVSDTPKVASEGSEATEATSPAQ
jgi:hypothetical protein